MSEDPLRIVLIEDNPGDAFLLEEALSEIEQFKYELEHFERLGDFLDHAGSLRPEVILLDLSLPDSQGLETLVRTHSALPFVPIIVLTGLKDEEMALDMLRHGAQDYLTKGELSASLLKRAIRYAIERQHAEDALRRAHDQLEERVRQRTAELEQATEELRLEIAERRKIEKERLDLLASERAARAEAEAANRAKDDFLATVSHELRTPLTSMLGWSRMLRSGNLNQSVSVRALEAIERAAQSQAQLIEDILDVSRIITGRLRLDVQEVDIAATITAAVDSIRPAAEAKSITLDVALEPGEISLQGDPGRLQQIVWNLLSNAVKFTPENGMVSLTLDRVDGSARVTVRDTGRGINSEFLPHVFDRFRQADGSSTRRHGGLGLGLSIVRHLVEMHGGTIQASSDGEGAGATFIVTLPADRVPSVDKDGRIYSSVRGEPGSWQSTGCRLTGLRLIVVDDNPGTLEFLEAVLESEGARVKTASSPVEALEILDGWIPDILVSDIAMPGEDGFWLINKVRARSPEEGGQVPAIALTAYVRAEDRVRVLSAGFNMFVPKPVEPAELFSILGSLVEAGTAKNSES